MVNKKAKVGINYRKEIAGFILKNLSYFDMIEVNSERFFFNSVDENLNEILSKIPCVLHGLSLSLGDTTYINDDYYSRLDKALELTNCMWFSEHIASTKVDGIAIRNLMPAPFTEHSAKRIIKKINQISQRTNKLFIIENITYYYPIPGSKMTELDFINLILNEANCGFLLDLNNLFCNSENHEYDAFKFIESLPKDKIIEIHLAGGSKIYNMEVDTHANKISEKVLGLFEYCCENIPFHGVILERDSGPLDFNELLEEISIINQFLEKHP